MLLEPLGMPKEILSCSGSEMSRKDAIRADRLGLTVPWLLQESAAVGCSVQIDLSSRDRCTHRYSLQNFCAMSWHRAHKNRKAQRFKGFVGKS